MRLIYIYQLLNAIMPSISHNRLEILPPGTVVRVWHGFYYHYGIIGPYEYVRERFVISHSGRRGGLVVEPFSEFSLGRDVFSEGYLGSLPPELVIERAMSHRGTPYSLTKFNCEHLIRFAHGVEPSSPQMAIFSILAAAVGLLAFSK